MDKPLKVLIVEDVERDAALLLRELRHAGYQPTFERVETAEGMAAALEKQPWNIIISDYVMPQFSALKALALMKEKGLELPFIIVSGTISEETAAEAMRAGAHDFMVKDKLARLVPAIEREIHEAAGRAEQKKMQEQLVISDRLAAAADTRERTMGDREELARLGEVAAGTREVAADTREVAADTREVAADTRERTMGDREELARLREEALSAREAAAEANEKLLLATRQAQELAVEAEVARAKIAESEERFRSLVTTSAAIVWQADAEGRHIDSPSWTAFTGLHLEDEGDWLQSVHTDDRERVRDAWRQATACRSLYVAEFRLRRREGSYAWVLARAVPIPVPPAPIREWVGMTTDISDSKRVEEAREQFIGILAHDLRNPLGAIEATAVLLGHAEDIPERHARNFARIARSTQRMAAMIRDVLDFTRGRLGGGIPIEREPCDLGDICAEAVEEMKQAYPGRAIHCDATGSLRGEWDPARIEQMLSNLIGNAVQHGLDPIRVAARADDGGGVIVTVHNLGRPIPAGLIPTLFEPFRRGERDGSQGLGLGLYIVSEIVRAHGASVSVSSSEHDGTIFTIQWPRRVPAPAPFVERRRT